jgi:hypothetical protein
LGGGNLRAKKESIMTRRAIVAGVIAFVVAVASVATVSNEALAFRGRGGARHVGGYHGGAHHVYRGAPVRRGVAVGVGAAAAGAAAGAYYGQLIHPQTDPAKGAQPDARQTPDASEPALRGSIEAHWRAVPICSDEKRPLSDARGEIERRAEAKSKRVEARELHSGFA